MPITLLALLLSCGQDTKATLPPPARVQPTANGRMVRAGPVQGYVARPLAPGEGRAGTLLLVEAQDEAAHAAALALAEGGGVALTVAPEIDTERARAYLAGMPDVATVAVQCRRAACP